MKTIQTKKTESAADRWDRLQGEERIAIRRLLVSGILTEAEQDRCVRRWRKRWQEVRSIGFSPSTATNTLGEGSS